MQAMAVLANILKTIQYVAIAYLTNWSVVASRCLTLQYALPGLLLLAFGQHLNAAVYRVLGVNGVYYGARFGKSIPWVKGYPYDRFRDPQVCAVKGDCDVMESPSADGSRRGRDPSTVVAWKSTDSSPDLSFVDLASFAVPGLHRLSCRCIHHRLPSGADPVVVL